MWTGQYFLLIGQYSQYSLPICRSARVLEEGYNNATRMKLDIALEAPVIVLPVSSRKPFTFEANLGNLRLQNHHHTIQHYAHTISLDTMTVILTNMNVSRSINTFSLILSSHLSRPK